MGKGLFEHSITAYVIATWAEEKETEVRKG